MHRSLIRLVRPWDAMPELAALPPAERLNVWREAYRDTMLRWQTWAAYGGLGLCAVLGDHLIGGTVGAMIGGGIGGVLVGSVVGPTVSARVPEVLAARKRGVSPGRPEE